MQPHRHLLQTSVSQSLNLSTVLLSELCVTFLSRLSLGQVLASCNVSASSPLSVSSRSDNVLSRTKCLVSRSRFGLGTVSLGPLSVSSLNKISFDSVSAKFSAAATSRLRRSIGLVSKSKRLVSVFSEKLLDVSVLELCVSGLVPV